MATGKIKATIKLADVIAQAGGRQINRLMSKLGMDKDILEGMSENQVKGAILDEAQKYMRNKRKNTNRRVGAAAAGGAAAYGVADFVHDMLGISSVSDGTLSAKERGNSKSKSGKGTYKAAPGTAYAPKEGDSKSRNKKPPLPKKLPKSKPKPKNESKVKFDTTGTLSKSKGGSIDYRVGGMVKSVVDNRKKK